MREALTDQALTNQLYRLYSDDQSYVQSCIIQHEWDAESRAFIHHMLSPTTQEALISRFHTQSAAIYTRFMIDNINHKEPGDLEDVLTTVLRKERPKLDRSILDALQSRTITNEKQLKPGVARGREFLRGYLRDLDLPQGAVILLYGSLQYNDPRNLDADILIALPRNITLTHRQTEQMDSLLEDSLIRAWKPYQLDPSCEPHATLTSINLIDTFAIDILLKGGEHADDVATEAAIILSGMPLYAESYRAFASIQKQCRAAVEQEPLLTALINKTLSNCLDVRKQRQS